MRNEPTDWESVTKNPGDFCKPVHKKRQQFVEEALEEWGMRILTISTQIAKYASQPTRMHISVQILQSRQTDGE
jgi:hypothetical protein